MTGYGEITAEDEAVALRKSAFQNLICSRKKQAIDARESSGIEEIWEDDEDQYNGYDDLNRPSTRKIFDKPVKADGRSRIYLNITKPKTKAAVSRVREMVLPHDDRPWQLDPTPVPELQAAADGKDNRMLTLADGQQASAEDVARAEMAKAKAACEKMSEQVEDWFVEGSVYSEMRRCVEDAGRIGSGVIKGPIPMVRRDRKWSMQGGVSALEIVERIAPGSKCISAWDFFPDPSCGTSLQNGSYCVERDYLTARQLRDLAKDPSYDQEAIVQCLKDGPMRSVRSDRQDREKPGDTVHESEVFETYYYYGDVPATDFQLFTDLGIVEEGMPPELLSVSALITLVNDRIVKAAISPVETGDFPFDVLPWEAVEGQLWGRGVPRQMQAAQRGLVASSRALMENAGMSSGPQVVIAKGQVTPADGKYAVTGRKLWFASPDAAGNPIDVTKVFGVVNIDTVQEQLMAIIEFFLRMSDELTNLPLLMQGTQGSAPDTVGGMAMLDANATSPLRDIAKQCDDYLFVPHLQRYYDWAMQDPKVPDEAKGDYQVWARGASVLVAREQTGMFLMQSAALLADPELRINKQKWLSEVARANKFDPSLIQYTDDEWKAKQEEMANNPPPIDPQVQIAQMKTEAMLQDTQAKVADAQEERSHKERLADQDRSMQIVLHELDASQARDKLSAEGQREFDKLKAGMAMDATKMRFDAQKFNAEMAVKQTQGSGI